MSGPYVKKLPKHDIVLMHEIYKNYSTYMRSQFYHTKTDSHYITIDEKVVFIGNKTMVDNYMRRNQP